MGHVEILLDSIGANNSAPRLTTWKLTLERFILAELNTHRAFSRNAASSRAIPFKRRLKQVLLDPVIPIQFGLNRSGMQASEEAKGVRLLAAKLIWRLASLGACFFAALLHLLGIHKQVVNRLLEPFVSVTVLVTCTQEGLENWFALRANGLADPHIQKLAYEMLEAYNASKPQILQPGEWHIPYGDRMDPTLSEAARMKVAVARAARLSYDNFNGKTSIVADIALHDQLALNGHWSSFEHIAQVPREGAPAGFSGNLNGWVQLRKTYPNELRKDSRVI